MLIIIDVTTTNSRQATMTRRDLLRLLDPRPALRKLQSHVAGFTSIADADFDLWFHRCFFGGLRYAGAG